MKKKNIAILGSTGSIGKSSIEIIRKNKKYKLLLIFFNKNLKEGLKQINEFKPKFVIVENYKSYLILKNKLKTKQIIILNNYNICKKFLKKIDITISAIPGILGLEPTLFFTQFSKKILIANKESIICGWNLLKREAKKYNTSLIPIDSEHFSINFLLKNYSINTINKIYITASGGPFLNIDKSKLKSVKPNQAVKHPKWKMGKKISVDSSTLMNKFLEVIEAIKLFSLSKKHLEIIIHPESLVHAIIELKNGLKIFLYHESDMKIPIANAIEHTNQKFKLLNFCNKGLNKSLSFLPVDTKKFPIVNLLKEVNLNNSSPIMINAANEIFVDEFLKKNIIFTDIYRFLKLFLNTKDYNITSKIKADSIKKVKEIDLLGRKLALKIISNNV